VKTRKVEGGAGSALHRGAHPHRVREGRPMGWCGRP